MIHKHRTKVALFAAAMLAATLTARALATTTTPSSAGSTSQSIDPLKIISIASSALTSLMLIFGTLTATFKSVRDWVVKKVRKALKIVEIEELMKKTTLQHNEDLNAATKERREQLQKVTEQNEFLGQEIKNLINKIDALNATMLKGQKCDRALIKDGITAIYFKYHRKREIPATDREKASQLFEVYTALGGNSYIVDLFDDLRTWPITFQPQEAGDHP
jgi:hypothetical protein